MPKFKAEVIHNVDEVWFVEVEAKDENEAREKAYEVMNERDCDKHIDGETNITTDEVK